MLRGRDGLNEVGEPGSDQRGLWTTSLTNNLALTLGVSTDRISIDKVQPPPHRPATPALAPRGFPSSPHVLG